MSKKVLSKKDKLNPNRIKRKYTRRAKPENANATVTASTTQATSTRSITEENNQNMNELLKALTNLALEATIFLAKKNGTLAAKVETAAAESLPEAPTAAAEPTPEPAQRKRKAKATEPAAPSADDMMADLGLAAEEKELTEKESLDLLMTTAGEYVTHFGKPKGIEQARAHLKPYKMEKITDLNHKQRQEYVKTLKAELAKAKA